MVTQQEAAVARAEAAKQAEARQRLSGLEQERRGYVVRGEDDRVAQVDEEIDRWSRIANPQPVPDADDAGKQDDGNEGKKDDGNEGEQNDTAPAATRRSRAKAAAAAAEPQER